MLLFKKKRNQSNGNGMNYREKLCFFPKLHPEFSQFFNLQICDAVVSLGVLSSWGSSLQIQFSIGGIVILHQAYVYSLEFLSVMISQSHHNNYQSRARSPPCCPLYPLVGEQYTYDNLASKQIEAQKIFRGENFQAKMNFVIQTI